MPPVVYISIAIVGYVLSVIWAHSYWSKYMNKNNINLIPEEVQVIIPMLFLWFFYWDGIEVVMKNADRKK